MTRQSHYNTLIEELIAIEAKTGLPLSNENVDRENCGMEDDGSEEFWSAMVSAAEMQAGMVAENKGQNINTLIGRCIY